jgi:predicted RND superfamily exporter protein
VALDLDRYSLAFSRWYIHRRGLNLLVIVALTVFFGWQALQLQVFSQFIDLLPRGHQYIQVYEKYNRQFGSANVLTAAIIAKEGDIYDEDALERVFAFTDQIDKVEGVDHEQVTSITRITIRDQVVDAEGIMRSHQIIGEEALALLEAQFFTRRVFQYARARGDTPPGDLEGLRRFVRERKRALVERLAPTAATPIEQIADVREREEVRSLRRENAELEFLLLRLDELPAGYRLESEKLVGSHGRLLPPEVVETLPDRIHQNKQVYGTLVSLDDRAALIRAGFLETRLDYERIFNEIQGLKRELEADGRFEVHLTGQPVLQGWTFFFKWEIAGILAGSLALLTILLGLYFRRWYGLVMPLTGALVSAIWGLGFIAVMGYQLEPLVLVIPMLITARAISHSVQFVERFYEEYERLDGDKEEATISSMAELIVPGTLAIITDAFGIFVIGVSSIFLMKKVALFGAFWAVSIIVTEMLLNRLLIVFFPPPRTTAHYIPGPIASLLHWIGETTTSRRAQRVTFGVWLLVVLGSFAVAPFVKVGEARPGTPILYESHEFNRSTGVISGKFFGADDLVVVVESEIEGGIHRPEVMHEIETFQRYMEGDPLVRGTISVVDFVHAISRTFHNGDPRWLQVPYTPQEIGGLLYLYEAGSPDPKILNPFRDQEAQNAAVRVFYPDHQGDTIRDAEARAKRYIRERPMGRVSVRLDTREDDWLATLFWWLGPLVPPREPDVVVQVQDAASGAYAVQAVDAPGRDEPPPEDSYERILTLPRVTKELRETLKERGYDAVQKLADADVEELATVEGFDLVTAYALNQAAELDRRHYTVTHEWKDEGRGVHVQVRKRGLYEPYELWVSYQGSDFVRRHANTWSEGPSLALASGLMGVLAASNQEVEGSNNATLVAAFLTTFLVILATYRSLSIALLMIASLGTAALVSLAYMYFTNIGFDVNTLPVQALGVGVGVDYALYLMDRVVHEQRRGNSLDESIRIAIRTTGMAVFFTGSTLVAGIILWWPFSSLRFCGDMSLLLCIILGGNMLGAIFLIPALASLFRLKLAGDLPPAGRS